MAQVFRARDRETGGEVALKVLKSVAIAEADRFIREAQVLSELDDETIVRYIAHGRSSTGELYLAMEWLDGEDLGQRLRRARLSIGEAITLGTRIARALSVAHRREIVHRDVKPGNVFLPGGSIERAKVLDFGIARWASAGAWLTTSGAILGTPSYMSPEQARGERQLDARTDVFALGCVLYECLLGTPAFSGSSALAILSKIMFQDPARPRAIRGDVPEALEYLLGAMLTKDPAGRPPDGTAVASALERIAIGSDDADGRGLASRALGESEQRFLAVLLVGAAGIRDSATRAAVQAAASGFGGTVEPLVDGSTIVAMSGVEATALDRVCQAARCALAIRRILPEAPAVLAMGRADLSEGLGVGEVMDRAAQLLGETPPGSDVRVDESAASMLEARFSLRRAGESVELLDEKSGAATGRTLLGRQSPFVGRDRELEIISAWFDECVSAPRARAIVVTAPAGYGKSRLGHELERRVFRDAQIWVARGDPTRVGAALGLLGPMIRRVMGIREGEPLEQRRRKLADYLADRVAPEQLEHTTLFLAEVISSPWSPEERPALAAARRDPRVLAEHMRRAFATWLAAECDVAPVVIGLDDLHWGDLPTVSFLEFALRELHDRPLFVLAMARPELEDLFPRLWAKRGALELRLGGLGKEACERLVYEYLPGMAVSGPLADRVVERASGNAFFLEELIRAVAEGNDEALPDTVLAMATARLEHLPAEARRVVRAASVFGEVFWQRGVAALVGASEAAAVDRWLLELEDHELISRSRDSRFSGEREFSFRHGLVRDAAYAMLTDADTKLGHRLAGEWLEQAGESQASVIAGHYARGGATARASVWNVRAAAQALEANDFNAVLEHGARALELGATGAQQREAHELRGSAFMGLGAWRDAPAELRSALERVDPGAQSDHVRLRLKLARACFFGFDLDGVREHAEAAIVALEGLDRGGLLAEATALLGVCDEARGDLTGAADAYVKARTQARGSFFPSEAQLMMALLWLGDTEACIERGQAFVDTARQMNDIYAYLVALPQVALALVARGRYDEAERLFIESRDVAVSYGTGPLAARAVAMSAGYRQDVFDFAAADFVNEEAREMARSSSYPPTTVSTSIDLLASAARAGDPGRADRDLAEVAEAVERTAGQGWHGWLFKLRFTAACAELALAKSDFEGGLAHARDVIAQSQACGRVKYLTIGQILSARATLGLGDPKSAIDQLTIALDTAGRVGDPALELRAGLPLLEVAGSDPLLARLRSVAASVHAALPESLRSTFATAEALAILGER